MKTILAFLIFASVIFLTSCQQKSEPKHARHVILIGLDGMGSYGFQRAPTPFMNEMVKNGALSLITRSVLESSSSQNWMTMLTGAIPIQHGVTSNEWEPDNHAIEPFLKNKKGFFPSIFDDIKSQKPDSKVFMFYEWEGLGRMFDLSVPDKVVYQNNGEKIMNEAIESFFNEKPDFLFVDIDDTDHAGHLYGHESQEYFDCISKYDALIGKLANRLEQEKMLENTVIIVTGDHGGLNHGHGGETAYEMQIPILLYGGEVTKGKMIEEGHIIADIAPTVAGLLGVIMPAECVGKFINAAFEPKTDHQFAPVPFIAPQPGFYSDTIEVTITTDSPEAKIFYTLDNSSPSINSLRYDKPFLLQHSAVIKAISLVGASHSDIESSAVRIPNKNLVPAVHYKYYENYSGKKIPDFKTLGEPTKQGVVYEFSLSELNIEKEDHFAVEFESQLLIEKSGMYQFTIASDDGANLFIDNVLLADNDGSHSIQKKKGTTELKKGMHKININYFDDTEGEFLELSYESDSIPKQVVPFSLLKN